MLNLRFNILYTMMKELFTYMQAFSSNYLNNVTECCHSFIHIPDETFYDTSLIIIPQNRQLRFNYWHFCHTSPISSLATVVKHLNIKLSEDFRTKKSRARQR